MTNEYIISKEAILKQKQNEEKRYKNFWDGVDGVVDIQTQNDTNNSSDIKNKVFLIEEDNVSAKDFQVFF